MTVRELITELRNYAENQRVYIQVMEGETDPIYHNSIEYLSHTICDNTQERYVLIKTDFVEPVGV